MSEPHEAVPESGDAPGSGTRYICSWLYADPPDEQLPHYQIRGESSSSEFQAVYWRCVALFYVTSARQQPEARHLFFTNADEIPTVDGVDIGELLASLGVEVVNLPLTHRTPEGYYHRWQNQFYTFDILRHLAGRLDPADLAIVLDADCVWRTSAEIMWDALERLGTLTYAVTYYPTWVNNGLSRLQMTDIAESLLGRSLGHTIIYCGGELQAASGTELRRLAGEIELVWEQLMERFTAGQPVFYEEGQTLSYVYAKLGYPIGTANPYLRRIFTDSLGRHNNTSEHDHGLVVWHVPLEKRLGLRRLYDDVGDRTSPLWTLPTGDELGGYLGGILGVPHSSVGKRARDLSRRLLDRARK